MTKRYRNIEDDKDIPDESDVLCIKNAIYFYAQVENKNILKLFKCLAEATDYATQHSEEPVVFLYINSAGGDAFSGLSAMDHIRCNKVPVITIADGYVASAATFLLLGGTARKSMTNAKLLIHQLSTTFWGKYVELLDEVENSKELMDNFKNIYLQQTWLSEKQLKSLLKKEIHMNAEKALEFGFVDEIW